MEHCEDLEILLRIRILSLLIKVVLTNAIFLVNFSIFSGTNQHTTISDEPLFQGKYFTALFIGRIRIRF